MADFNGNWLMKMYDDKMDYRFFRGSTRGTRTFLHKEVFARWCHRYAGIVCVDTDEWVFYMHGRLIPEIKIAEITNEQAALYMKLQYA